MPQDHAEAIRWFCKAVDWGAQFWISWLYQNGRGVAQDITQARAWMAKGGCSEQ